MNDNPFASASDSFTGADPWADRSDLELLKAERFQRWLGAFVDGMIPVIVMLPLGFGWSPSSRR